MGNVRKHGKGWQLIYQRAGKRHWETILAGNKTEAMKVLKIREGKACDPRNAPELTEPSTFDDLCQFIETDYHINQRRTTKDLRLRLNHLRAFFAGMTGNKITTERVSEYTKRRQEEGAASATINRELAALKRMLNLALRAGRLFQLPAFPRLREANPRQGFFEAGAFLRVLEALPEHLRPAVKFGYYTGWRLSEITSLAWTQVDWQAGTIRLWPGTTKNGQGRVFKLKGELDNIIKAQHGSLPEGCPWVFYRRLKESRRPLAAQKGGYSLSQRQTWKPVRTFYKAWKRACKAAGCPGMLFHDLRRTAARNFRRAGLQPDEAMMLTGHKTYSVFQRYSIVNETDLEDIAWRAQAFMAGTLAECAKTCQTTEGNPKGHDGQLIKAPVR